MMKVMAGTRAYRDSLTNYLDNKHDGDTVSTNAVYSEESIKEIDTFLTKKKAYVGIDGRFLNSTDIATTSLVLHNLTG